MALLDVVVVNHRTPQLFYECTASLERYLGVDYEIYSVDNSPSGHVGQYVIENKGYGQACNYGADLGSSEFILLLNADTRATDRSNTAHVMELFRSDPSIAVIGPKQVNPAGWIASAGCPPANNGVGYTIRGWKQRDRGQYDDILDCVYVAGSVVFTRRDVWEHIGGFLETPLYYEEAYYCYVARHLGHRVVYDGQALWIHHWDSSPKPDQHLQSGRPVAKVSHEIFVNALRMEGVPEAEIPPFV